MTHLEPRRDLRSLPKAHLHLHLEAAMRPETLVELAAVSGVEIPPVAGFSGFGAFAAMYQGLLAVLSEPAHLERLIDEAVADEAAAGSVYVEFGVSPQFYVDTYGSLLASLDRHLEWAAAAGERHGVAVGLMMTGDRTRPVEEAIALAEAAAARADAGMASFGLANEERGYPAADFEVPFRIATDAGLLSTPHAGELVGPESIRQAVEVLRADRILHGIRVLDDPELVIEIAERGITLDTCPTSNVVLDVVPSLAEHPLPQLLAAGVACSINADDPILFGPGLLDEYEAARHGIGLDDEALAACARASVLGGALSTQRKTQALADIDAWLAAEPA